MGGADGPGQAGLGHDSQAVGLILGEDSVGGNDTDSTVGLADEGRERRAGAQRLHTVHKGARGLAAGPSNDTTAVWVDDLTKAVDGNEGADSDAGDRALTGSAQAALEGPLQAEDLGHSGAGASANVALLHSAVGSGLAGGVASVGIGPDVRAAQREIEEDGADDDGDDACRDGEAAAALLQPAHDASGGVQAVSAATGKKDGVDALHEVAGPQEVGLTGAGGATADIDGGDRAILTEDDGAACGGLPVAPVAHLEAGDPRYGINLRQDDASFRSRTTFKNIANGDRRFLTQFPDRPSIIKQGQLGVENGLNGGYMRNGSDKGVFTALRSYVQSLRGRRAVMVAGALTFLAGLLILSIGLFSYFQDDNSARGSTPSPVVVNVETPTPILTPTVTASPTATPVPAPPLGDAPFRMIIEKIKVDAPVQTFGLDANAIPETPTYQNSKDPANIVAWYNFSARPGTGSNAAFSGHVDWDGAAVFYNLKKLKVGDTIKLRGEDGTELVYAVSDTFLINPDDPNARKVMDPTPADAITLITCEGDWTSDPSDRVAGGSYSDRRVVRAGLVSITAAGAPRTPSGGG